MKDPEMELSLNLLSSSFSGFNGTSLIIHTVGKDAISKKEYRVFHEHNIKPQRELLYADCDWGR